MPAPHITGTVLQQDTRQQYIANGLTDIFVYPFFIPEDQDLNVYITPAGNQENEKLDITILNTDYTVQDAGNQLGGTITFVPASIPGVASLVTIVRNVKDTITTNYADAQTITGSNLDESFEREMLVTQQNVNNSEQRSLRYQDSAFLPASETRNIVPTLDPNFIWKGSASGGVIAVEDQEESGCSSLRSELANSAAGTDGAGLVGWFNILKGMSTTVRNQLNLISSRIFGADGAREVGYFNPVDLVETTVGDELDIVAGFPQKLQDNFALYGNAVGTPDALEVNIIPAYKGYIPGTKVFVKILSNNETQTPTLNLNGLGAKNIVNNDGQSIDPNTMQANGIYQFVYDGVNFQLLHSPVSKGLFSQIDHKTIENTSAEISALGTLAGTTTLEANSLIPGSFYRYILKADVRKTTASGTIFIRFRVNGVLILEEEVYLGGISHNNVRHYDFLFELKVTSIGSPSTIDLWAKMERFDTTVDVKSPEVIEKYVLNTLDIDSTIPNTIDITAQFTQADIANFFVSKAATVDKIY